MPSISAPGSGAGRPGAAPFGGGCMLVAAVTFVLAATLLGAGGAVLALLVPGSATGSGAPAAGDAALGPAAGIPAPMRALYQSAAASCPGLPWTVLAGIGTVESGNGTSTLPGVRTGANAAGAEGPMQFEPATFAAYAVPVPPGGAVPASPYDPADAVFAAARLLCANGARGGADLPGAVFTYNHSAAYVAEVLALAWADGSGQAAAPAGGGAAGLAVAWALGQVGTPYVWGGEAPGQGFDCSGLAQAAFRAAGVTLPRVAQDQFDAGPHVAPGAPLQPGDLVFFGGGPAAVTHVGIVTDPAGRMVDAPFTGATVRVDPFPTTPGTGWGSDIYVGATRPAG